MNADISINVTLKLRIRPYESLHDLVAVVGDKEEEVLRRVTLDQWHRICTKFDMEARVPDPMPKDIRDVCRGMDHNVLDFLCGELLHSFNEHYRMTGRRLDAYNLTLAQARHLWHLGLRPIGRTWASFAGVLLLGEFRLCDMPGKENIKLPSPKTSEPVAKCTVDPMLDAFGEFAKTVEKAFDGVEPPNHEIYSPPEIPVADTCAECYGTGHRMGFGAPCSRGCGRKS